MSEQVPGPTEAVAAHLPLLAIGVGAAILRVASYIGPPRPWSVIALDCVVMTATGFGVAEATMAAGWGIQGALASGVASGLVGWEAVKRILAARITRKD